MLVVKVKKTHVFVFKMDKKWKLIITGLIAIFIIYLSPLWGEIPDDMIEKAKEIDKMSKDKLELTRNIYFFVNNSYTSELRQYLKEPNKVLMKDTTTIWGLRGSYMPSNAQNEIFRRMLILTGKFKESEFIYHQSFCQISPHEYYELKIENQTYFIDLWGEDWGIPFGCYAPAPCSRGVAVCP